jgi:restriction endonuclease S
LIGVVQKALTIVILSKIEIPLPIFQIQQKIAAVLSDLDDKIVLNRRIAAKLEAMTKHLYDYWFVQFDFPNADGNLKRKSKNSPPFETVCCHCL